MIVKENISFERGKDPRETMEIGLDSQMIQKYGEKRWKNFKRMNDLSHISQNFEWVSEIQTDEEDPYFNIESYFYYTDAEDGSKIPIQFVVILQEDGIIGKEIPGRNIETINRVRDFVDFTEAFEEDDDWQGLFEGVNFERGKDPRDQMEIGVNKNFQDAIERLLLRDANDRFIINSIAFPKWSKTIDFVVDDWSEGALEYTKPFLMNLSAEDEWFDIFDFIDSDSFTGGDYNNGVYKFVANIDPAVVKGLRGKMILAEDTKRIKIMDL